MRDARHPTSPSAGLATNMSAKMWPRRPRGGGQESNLDARGRLGASFGSPRGGQGYPQEAVQEANRNQSRRT